MMIIPIPIPHPEIFSANIHNIPTGASLAWEFTIKHLTGH